MNAAARGYPPRTWLLVAVVVLAAHGLALIAPFQFDDLHQLANNGAFTDPSALLRFFTDPWVGSGGGHMISYRPLLYSSFLLEGLVGGGAAWPYRVVSLLSLTVFALTAGRFATHLLPRLVSGVGDRRLRRAGLLVALLVAAHPIFGESVLMASSRSSLWMATFGLLALTELLRETPRSVWVAGWLVLAFLTKETAVTIAPLALLVTLLPGRMPLRRRLMSLWPVVVVTAGYILFYKLVFQAGWVQAGGGNPYPASLGKRVTGLDYAAQGGHALLGLLRLLLVPWGMSPVHDLRPPAGMALVVGWATWGLAAMVSLAGIVRGGAARLAGFALGWFVLAMVPTLVLVPLNTPFAEHRVVLAAVLPLLALGWWLSADSRRVRRGGVALLAALAVLAALQAWPWRGELAMWEHQVRVEPGSLRAWDFLAKAKSDRGDLGGAAVAVRRALEIAPDNPMVLAKAGWLAVQLGDMRAAEAYMRRGLSIEGNLSSLHQLASRLHAGSGELGRALHHANEAVRLSPRDATAWNALGNIRWLLGQHAAAAAAYRSALGLDPAQTEAAANLARVQRILDRS